jgi:hypothetical protein
MGSDIEKYTTGRKTIRDRLPNFRCEHLESESLGDVIGRIETQADSGFN